MCENIESYNRVSNIIDTVYGGDIRKFSAYLVKKYSKMEVLDLFQNMENNHDKWRKLERAKKYNFRDCMAYIKDNVEAENLYDYLFQMAIQFYQSDKKDENNLE